MAYLHKTGGDVQMHPAQQAPHHTHQSTITTLNIWLSRTTIDNRPARSTTRTIDEENHSTKIPWTSMAFACTLSFSQIFVLILSPLSFIVAGANTNNQQHVTLAGNMAFIIVSLLIAILPGSLSPCQRKWQQHLMLPLTRVNIPTLFWTIGLYYFPRTYQMSKTSFWHLLEKITPYIDQRVWIIMNNGKKRCPTIMEK